MKSNLGKTIKITGIVLGILTILAGFIIFLILADGYRTEDFAWAGLIVVLAGLLECLVLAGFGQLVLDVNEIRIAVCSGKVEPASFAWAQTATDHQAAIAKELTDEERSRIAEQVRQRIASETK